MQCRIQFWPPLPPSVYIRIVILSGDRHKALRLYIRYIVKLRTRHLHCAVALYIFDPFTTILRAAIAALKVTGISETYFYICWYRIKPCRLCKYVRNSLICPRFCAFVNPVTVVFAWCVFYTPAVIALARALAF